MKTAALCLIFFVVGGLAVAYLDGMMIMFRCL